MLSLFSFQDQSHVLEMKKRLVMKWFQLSKQARKVKLGSRLFACLLQLAKRVLQVKEQRDVTHGAFVSKFLLKKVHLGAILKRIAFEDARDKSHLLTPPTQQQPKTAFVYLKCTFFVFSLTSWRCCP